MYDACMSTPSSFQIRNSSSCCYIKRGSINNRVAHTQRLYALFIISQLLLGSTIILLCEYEDATIGLESRCGRRAEAKAVLIVKVTGTVVLLYKLGAPGIYYNNYMRTRRIYVDETSQNVWLLYALIRYLTCTIYI